MTHDVYFWREFGSIPLTADSVLERLAEDSDRPEILPLCLTSIKDAFERYFPGTVAVDAVTFHWVAVKQDPVDITLLCDSLNRPRVVCVSSELPLSELPQVSKRLFDAMRQIGATRIESAIR